MGSRCIAEVADATIYLPVSKPMVDHHVVQLSMDWVKGKTIFFPKKKQSIEIKIYDILRTMEVPQYWNQWMRGCQSSWRFAVYEEEGIHNGLPVKMGCDLHRED